MFEFPVLHLFFSVDPLEDLHNLILSIVSDLLWLLYLLRFSRLLFFFIYFY